MGPQDEAKISHLGHQTGHRSTQDSALDGSFWGTAFGSRFDTPNYPQKCVFREAKCGWNVINSISKQQFQCFCRSPVFWRAWVTLWDPFWLHDWPLYAPRGSGRRPREAPEGDPILSPNYEPILEGTGTLCLYRVKWRAPGVQIQVCLYIYVYIYIIYIYVYIYTKYTKHSEHAPKTYPNISKYIKIYEDIPRNTKYRAAAGPPRRNRRLGGGWAGASSPPLGIV